LLAVAGNSSFALVLVVVLDSAEDDDEDEEEEDGSNRPHPFIAACRRLRIYGLELDRRRYL